MSDVASGIRRDELFAAIEAGDIERVRDIVRASPTLAGVRGGDGISAVLAARYRWRPDIVDVLLAADPPLDVFEAAAVGRTDRLAELLADDPSLTDGWSVDGFTPLHLAAFFGHVTAVRLLLAYGANPGASSRNDMVVMPLHSATAGRQAETVKALIDGGATVDARTHGGYTPLMEAAANGDAASVSILLAAGADPSLRNDDGRTAITIAEEDGRLDLVETLRAPQRGQDRR